MNIAPINYIKLGRAGPKQRREALAALLPPGHRLLPAPGLPARSAPPGSDASDELVVRHVLHEWAHRWALAHGAGHVLQILRILHDNPVDGDKDLFGKDRKRPDFLIEFEHFVVVVEVDERGHGRTNAFARRFLSAALRYRRSAEDARMLKIYEQILEIYGKPTKFIRLATPDSQSQRPNTATLLSSLERVVADGTPTEREWRSASASARCGGGGGGGARARWRSASASARCARRRSARRAGGQG
eukprot:tig00000319_g24128.t1